MGKIGQSEDLYYRYHDGDAGKRQEICIPVIGVAVFSASYSRIRPQDRIGKVGVEFSAAPFVQIE